MSTVRTVAATIALMFGASVGHAQSAADSQRLHRLSAGNRPLYFACWAEVPSQNTAYFSATFLMSAVNTLEDQFRTFVTTQYGPVSELECTDNFGKAIVTERVEKWKDAARTNKNTVVELLGDTGAPQPQSPQAASIKQDDVSCHYLDSPGGRIKQRVCGTPPEIQALSHLDGVVPGGYVPGNASGTVAGQSNVQR